MNAAQVLKKYWSDGGAPIDPFWIAAQAGIVCIGNPRMQGSGHYDPEGLIDGVTLPIITYNSSEAFVRQRFTVAHELGHHFSGDGPSDRQTPAQFTLSSSDKKEIAANKFAACLLIPENALQAAIHVKHMDNVENLARAFQVSLGTMRYRLREVGYHV